MAFSISNLAVLAYAQGFTLWHYKSRSDKLGQIDERGYFDDASDMLVGGDLVMISSPDGARIINIVGCEAGVTTAALQ